LALYGVCKALHVLGGFLEWMKSSRDFWRPRGVGGRFARGFRVDEGGGLMEKMEGLRTVLDC